MNSFVEIILAWPSVDQMATDVGVDKDTVRKWKERDSIPDWHWKAVLAKAPDRGIELSPELMIELAARD